MFADDNEIINENADEEREEDGDEDEGDDIYHSKRRKLN